MKIKLYNFDSSKLFPKGTNKEDINGVHSCMSGAQYIVDLNEMSLTYIGGVSPMFVHSDFPVGCEITVNAKSIKLLKKVTRFEVEYSSMLTVNFKKTSFSFEVGQLDMTELNQFKKHLMRILPNSWECASMVAINTLLTSATSRSRRKSLH